MSVRARKAARGVAYRGLRRASAPLDDVRTSAGRQADTGAGVPVMLLATNAVIGFIAAVTATVYASYGDAPLVYMAQETGLFLLRQLSVVRDLIGGILSFNLF